MWKLTVFLFIKINHVILTQVGFCVISPWSYLDSFQITKKRSYDGYSIYISIFNSFFKGVYPIGVTDLLPYFTQIIGHNSVNVHQIPTTVGTEICHNDPFKCAKFQPNPSTHSCFMVDFAKCANEDKGKKTKKLKWNFVRSYLGNGLSDFLQIWYVDFPILSAILQQIWFQSDKGSQSYIGVKIAFSLC